ncbi:MAG TPA: ribonuclease III [Candidatus Baltobacteraceae bacterium]|nr:ribonuclease III [Candidatus Baltobacteraceae bacterium]
MAGEQRRRRLRALLKKAHAAPADLDLFEQAFTHESAARERRGISNERLEFLGDSVLGFVAATWLYERHPDEDEGWLTRRKAALVNDRALAQTALRLAFPEMMQLGEGMARSGGAQNETILADAFEAFLGALFLRYGESKTRRFLVEQHLQQVDLSDESVMDSKSRLQHLMQERYRQVPVYRDDAVGSPQEPRFTSQVILKDTVLGSGTGRSKKQAQLEAAGKALETLLAQPRAQTKKKTKR